MVPRLAGVPSPGFDIGVALELAILLGFTTFFLASGTEAASFPLELSTASLFLIVELVESSLGCF